MGHANTVVLRRPKFGGQKTTPKRGPKMSLGVQLFCAKLDRFLSEPFSQNVNPPTRFVGIVRRPILSQRKRRPSLTVQRFSHPDIASSFYFPGLKFSYAFADGVVMSELSYAAERNKSREALLP